MEEQDFEELNRLHVDKNDILLLQAQESRKKEYPPIEDFADAWVKQDESALEEYRQRCLAVKVKYPKPE